MSLVYRPSIHSNFSRRSHINETIPRFGGERQSPPQPCGIGLSKSHNTNILACVISSTLNDHLIPDAMRLEQPLQGSFILRPKRPQNATSRERSRSGCPEPRRQPLEFIFTRREFLRRRLYEKESLSSEGESSLPTQTAKQSSSRAMKPPPLTRAATATATSSFPFKSDSDSSLSLRLKNPRSSHSSRSVAPQILPWNKQVVDTANLSQALQNLQYEFEPPAEADYWKRRCFYWQDLARQQKQSIRNLEEDQRQLRRRIHALENQVLWTASQPSRVLAASEPKPQTAPPTDTTTSSRKNAIPSIIIVEPSRRCGFYLTDCEGLSDDELDEELLDCDCPDDYSDDHSDEEDRDTDEGVREVHRPTKKQRVDREGPDDDLFPSEVREEEKENQRGNRIATPTFLETVEDGKKVQT